MDIIKEDFNEYMEFFKQQTLKEKQSIIFEQMKMILSLADNLCNEVGIKSELILNKEMLDLNNLEYTEDDFAEAIIVLVNSIQNSICDLSNGLVELVNNIE